MLVRCAYQVFDDEQWAASVGVSGGSEPPELCVTGDRRTLQTTLHSPLRNSSRRRWRNGSHRLYVRVNAPSRANAGSGPNKAVCDWSRPPEEEIFTTDPYNAETCMPSLLCLLLLSTIATVAQGSTFCESESTKSG